MEVETCRKLIYISLDLFQLSLECFKYYLSMKFVALLRTSYLSICISKSIKINGQIIVIRYSKYVRFISSLKSSITIYFLPTLLVLSAQSDLKKFDSLSGKPFAFHPAWEFTFPATKHFPSKKGSHCRWKFKFCWFQLKIMIWLPSLPQIENSPTNYNYRTEEREKSLKKLNPKSCR